MTRICSPKTWKKLLLKQNLILAKFQAISWQSDNVFEASTKQPVAQFQKFQPRYPDNSHIQCPKTGNEEDVRM